MLRSYIKTIIAKEVEYGFLADRLTEKAEDQTLPKWIFDKVLPKIKPEHKGTHKQTDEICRYVLLRILMQQMGFSEASARKMVKEAYSLEHAMANLIPTK